MPPVLIIVLSIEDRLGFSSLCSGLFRYQTRLSALLRQPSPLVAPTGIAAAAAVHSGQAGGELAGRAVTLAARGRASRLGRARPLLTAPMILLLKPDSPIQLTPRRLTYQHLFL